MEPTPTGEAPIADSELQLIPTVSADEPSEALAYAGPLSFRELMANIDDEAFTLGATRTTPDDADELCPDIAHPAHEMDPVDEDLWDVELDSGSVSVRLREFLSVRRTIGALTGTTRSWESCSNVVYRSDNQVRREFTAYRSDNRNPGVRLVETFHSPNVSQDEGGFEADHVLVGSETYLVVAVDKWLIEVAFDSFSDDEQLMRSLEEDAEELIASIESVLLE